MRYFNISINLSLPGDRTGFAASQFESEEFPSFDEIYGKFEKIAGKGIKIVIIGIFEFKNENDYNSYLGKSLAEEEQTYADWMEGLFDYLSKKIFLSRESFDKMIDDDELKFKEIFLEKLEYSKVVAKLF